MRLSSIRQIFWSHTVCPFAWHVLQEFKEKFTLRITTDLFCILQRLTISYNYLEFAHFARKSGHYVYISPLYSLEFQFLNKMIRSRGNNHRLWIDRRTHHNNKAYLLFGESQMKGTDEFNQISSMKLSQNDWIESQLTCYWNATGISSIFAASARSSCAIRSRKIFGLPINAHNNTQ